MTYEEKKAIANEYLSICTNGAIDWDTLPDINSLHDVEDEVDIKQLCDDRLEEEGFDLELFNEL